MDEKKLKETAERIYNFLEPWQRVDTTPAEIVESIKKDPTETIIYLLDLLEN